MTYLVLARKYRPQTFTEMMGQEHVLRALQNALDNQKLHHAYLFTGTRGVGKTTVARLFAKSLNCEKGISSTPCNQCSSCLEITTGRHVDLLEIDAASRTKVEDTRDLLDNVQYSPQKGRFKIYLIDEVHMLSGHSFNALLKTLEEPPAHVKFLLATTDPQKLPVTVVSRCLQFHLKNMSSEQIIDQLNIILPKENINYEKSALEIIAQSAQGSMRDALSLTDQCIAYCSDNITETAVSALLGLAPSEKILEILSLITQNHNNSQKENLINLVNNLGDQNIDFLELLNNLIIILQKMAIYSDSINNNYNNIIITPETIQLYYQIALIGKKELPLSPDPKLGFLMTVIRMLVFTPKKPENIQTENIKSENIKPATPKNTAWENIIDDLNLSGVSKLLAQNCAFEKNEADNTITLTLDETQKALLAPAAQERLITALQHYVGNTCKINFISGKSDHTPAKSEQKAVEAVRQKAQQEILTDPAVQSLMQTFSATLT